jgi:hypothetical protein
VSRLDSFPVYDEGNQGGEMGLRMGSTRFHGMMTAIRVARWAYRLARGGGEAVPSWCERDGAMGMVGVAGGRSVLGRETRSGTERRSGRRRRIGSGKESGLRSGR